MSSSLQPYDENALCPKCGFGSLATAYHPHFGYPCAASNAPLGAPYEHLCHACHRCAYTWAVAVVPSREVLDA